MLERRIASTATTVTVGGMWFGITRLADLLAEHDPPLRLGSLLVSLLLSVGIYRLVALALTSAFGKYRWLRRLFLGREFIEGTWIGHYFVEGDNAHRYTVEHISQTTDAISVEGTEFHADGTIRSTWQSDTAAVVDSSRRLVYAYRCTILGAHSHQGLAEFNLVRVKPHEAPKHLDGWAADLIDGKKDPNRERKLSDGLLNKDEAFRQALIQFGPSETVGEAP